ncbi:MAG: zinc ABC transporter substrate-binding protein [Rhodocyclaceae bacterium]
MTRLFLVALLCLGLTGPARAGLNVFATLPEWGALARVIGGDAVTVFVATHARQDPHHIEARPSLIARARQADLVVANGAELEIGWLPAVLSAAGNRAIQPGLPGYFEAAAQVTLLEVPARVDRADGDVHPAGNPHIGLDPRLLLTVGAALQARMAALDPAQAAVYDANWSAFRTRWQAAIDRWQARAAPLRGRAIVVHHTAYPYFTHWLGLTRAGTLEPKPGVAPGSAHLAALRDALAGQRVLAIVRPPYAPEGPGQWLAGQSGIPLLRLPIRVEASADEAGLTAWFDGMIDALLATQR